MDVFDTAGLRRAKLDIDEGRLWKARDRLGGLLLQRPADQQVLSLLGEVFFRMGDYPAAGRFWFLTERKGSEVDIAMTSLRERYPNSQSLGRAIPVRAPADAFPEGVRNRLLDENIFHFLNPQARVQLPKDWNGFRRPCDPLRRTPFGKVGVALMRAFGITLALLVGFTGVKVGLEQSDGWVLLPVGVTLLVSAGFFKIDSTIRARRLARLKESRQGASS